MKLSSPIPRNFNFWATVYSHGWCALPPFRVDEERRRLHVVIPNGNGGYDEVELYEKKKALFVSVENKSSHSPQKISRIRNCVASMLRTEESFEEFYAESKRHSRYRWISKCGAGRLLRCPTVFEDVVKMICTTNCSWALTGIIVKALVTKLGTHLHDDVYSFPSPEVIASCSESFLRKEIRCGYRAPYLLELSRKIVSGKLGIEEWRTSEAPTEELFEEVRSVKGVGEYAAGNILKLLGRYDYLGLDSWCRGKFYELFKKGRRVKDSTIEKYYAPYGKWRGLFLWMDVTKDWYTKEIPF
ncbi:MAG: 3-methyladenine DNA glycosylase [Bacteroidota bacterium]